MRILAVKKIGPMIKAILFVLLFSVTCFTDTYAGFLVKKQTITIPTANKQSSAPTMQRLEKRFHTYPRHHGELPKGIYIAFCILPLGWLAIAINENFTQQTWIFSLLLYLLLYAPGVIYSLMQMHKYYR